MKLFDLPGIFTGLILLATPLIIGKIGDTLSNGGLIELANLKGVSNDDFGNKIDILTFHEYAGFASLNDCIQAGKIAVSKENYVPIDVDGTSDFSQFNAIAQRPSPLRIQFECVHDSRFNETNWTVIVSSLDKAFAENIRNKIYKSVSADSLNIKQK